MHTVLEVSVELSRGVVKCIIFEDRLLGRKTMQCRGQNVRSSSKARLDNLCESERRDVVVLDSSLMFKF